VFIFIKIYIKSIILFGTYNLSKYKIIISVCKTEMFCYEKNLYSIMLTIITMLQRLMEYK
jgi:hypothetical protein